MKVILSDDVGRRAERPENGVFFALWGVFAFEPYNLPRRTKKAVRTKKNGVSALSAVLLQNARARCFALVQG